MTSPTLSFDGTDDYVQTTVLADFGTGPFTVCGWLYLNDTGKFTVASTYDGTVGWILDDGNGNGQYRLWTTGGNHVNGSNLITDEWHHYTGVRQSDGTLILYLNGTMDVSGPSPSSDVTNSPDMVLGERGNNSSYLNGSMDDVRVFDTALTQSEIQSVMDGHVIGSEVAHYAMNEGSGSTLSDATTNNNSGTINGATWISRSGGTTYDWQTSTDWDNSQSNQNVVHQNELKLGVDGGTYVEIGQYTGQFGGAEEAYYSISSIDPTTVYDNTAANNDSLTVSGTTKVEENNTRFPQSLSFDGTDDYVKLPSTIQDTTSVVGTELWFYPRSTGSQVLMYFHDFYGLYFDPFGNQQMWVYAFGDSVSLGPTNIALDTWHHCNFYWDIGTEYGISIDGGTWDTYTTTHTPSNQSDVSYLGVNGFNATAYFDGKLTELRFVADQRINRAESFYQDQGNLVTARKS